MTSKAPDPLEELKQSVEFNNTLIETLKSDNASLLMEVNELKHKSTKFHDEKAKMAKVILDLQCRSMRDNIIIHGVPERENETYQQSKELAKSFLKDELKMRLNKAEDIRFSIVHRIGRAKAGQQSPIVAKTVDLKMKFSIMAKG